MTLRIKTTALIALIAFCMGGHFNQVKAEPFNLTKATSGYLYFNRSGADVVQHDGELKNCIANWAGGWHPGPASPSLGQGVVGDTIGGMVQDVMMSGWEKARQNINIEHCMVAKGWRLVRLSEDEGQRLSLLPQKVLAAALEPYITADVPRGEIVRTWRNEELYSDTIIVSSPRNADRQMLSIAALSPDHSATEDVKSVDIESIGDVIVPWNDALKRNQPKSLDQTIKPGPGQALLIYTLRMPKKKKFPLYYLERARVNRAESVDYFGLFSKEFESLPDGSVVATMAMLVPSGKWFVQGVWLNMDNCMGAPTFEVESGATVYLGTFDTRSGKIKVDVGEQALKDAFAGSSMKAVPVQWVNGFTYPCRPNSMYSLEFEDFSFLPDYKWGSRAQSTAK